MFNEYSANKDYLMVKLITVLRQKQTEESKNFATLMIL